MITHINGYPVPLTDPVHHLTGAALEARINEIAQAVDAQAMGCVQYGRYASILKAYIKSSDFDERMRRDHGWSRILHEAMYEQEESLIDALIGRRTWL